jgi:deazaflavin-dependent oxidoreductase (nitroreductase family)
VNGTLADVATEPFCYVTTNGRVTGQPHGIEIWFAVAPGRDTIFLLAGGRERSDWVRNLQADPTCTVEIGEHVFDGRGHVIEGSDDDPTARDLVYEKYRHDDDLDEWRDAALPVAIELTVRAVKA